MNSYSILHTLPNAIYSANTYYQIYVDPTSVFVFKGVLMPTPDKPIIYNLSVDSEKDIIGSNNILLIGKLNPILNYYIDGTEPIVDDKFIIDEYGFFVLDEYGSKILYE
jgi:hypothetical protein